MSTLPTGLAVDARTAPALLLELRTKSFDNILTHAISPDATWLAYSCAGGSRVFQLDVDGDAVDVHPVHALNESLPFALNLAFTADSKRLLLLSNTGVVTVLTPFFHPTVR